MDDEKVYTVNDVNDIGNVLRQICDDEISLRISMVQRTAPARTELLSVDFARERFELRAFDGLDSLLEETKKLSLMANIDGLTVDLRSCEFKAWVDMDSGKRVALFSFPHSIVRSDARSTFRAQVIGNYPLSAGLCLGDLAEGVAPDEELVAEVDDISAAGMRLRFPEMSKLPWGKDENGLPIRPSMDVKLSYKDQDERANELDVLLQVRWCRLMTFRKNTPPQLCIGGEFLDLNGNQSVQLSRLVVDVQLAERRSLQERRG